MKKKILFIDHHAELGGGEIALLEILKNIDKEKFSLLAALGNSGPLKSELEKAGIGVIVMDLPGYFRKLQRDPSGKNSILSYVKSLFALPALETSIRKIIEENNIDTVYVNSIKSALYAVKPAKQLGKKVIWHLHDCLMKDFYSKWAIKIIMKVTRKTDKVICVSEAVKRYFIQAGGDSKKSEVVYNGVDTQRFNPDILAENLKEQLGLKEKKVVSIIGRLEPWKGQRIFIKAAEIISKKRSDIIFLITGGPIFGFAEYEKELKTVVGPSGLTNKITFLGFREDTEKIYAVSDIIAHCSLRPEPFGRDIIEAFACGKPVIATNLGGPQEIIINGKNGILIEPGNPELLADAIAGLVNNKEAISSMGKEGRKTAEEIFNIKNIAKSIEFIL